MRNNATNCYAFLYTCTDTMLCNWMQLGQHYEGGTVGLLPTYESEDCKNETKIQT